MERISQIPQVTHPINKGEVTIEQQVSEAAEFDQIAIAQSSMPQVVQRVTELENCMWALAVELQRLDPHNEQIERAKLLMKNRLEIFDSSKPFRGL